MEKTCLKCGKVGHTTGNPLDACTHCGAIYAKVEAAHASGDLRPKPVPKPAPIPELPSGLLQPNKPHGSAQPRNQSREQFVEQLRQESLYPTTRGLVNFVYKVVSILCAIMAVMALIVGFSSASGMAAFGAAFFSVALFGIFWLFTKIGTEMSVMVIDLCDASVRTAYHQEQRD